jgi:hypothetical protein
MNLARRNLMQDKTRFAVSVTGVALAVMLILIVSHDQRIKDIADWVLWLEDGRFKAATSMARDPTTARPGISQLA